MLRSVSCSPLLAAALQEYDGIWRFAWAHSSDSLLDPQPINYFDVSRDPLQRLTERAVIALYLRGDLKPLERTFAIVLPESRLRQDFSCGPHADIHEMWYGWHARFGTWVGEGKPSFDADLAVFPAAYANDKAYYQQLAGQTPPGDGQVKFDREHGMFGVTIARTAGFFAESGKHECGPLAARLSLAPAAVWVSSLDGAAIPEASRLLLTHATDVQDTQTVYGDREKTILKSWGRLPHLMRAGKAEIVLALKGEAYRVHALAADG